MLVPSIQPTSDCSGHMTALHQGFDSQPLDNLQQALNFHHHKFSRSPSWQLLAL